MTDCCLSPRAEGMTAHTARCLLAQQPTTNVARLRALIGGGGETETDEQGDQA